jgi:hypothetical protein
VDSCRFSADFRIRRGTLSHRRRLTISFADCR